MHGAAHRNVLVFMCLMVVSVAVVVWGLARGEEDVGVGDSAQAHLNFEVTIPKIISLRIGGEGTSIDTVHFDVEDVSAGSPVIRSSTAPAVTVGAVIGNASNVTLSVDSSSGLIGNTTGVHIPFSAITSSGTGDFNSVNDLAFDGSSDQVIWQGVGGGYRSGTFSFSLPNTTAFPPDTYIGEIVYTISAP